MAAGSHAYKRFGNVRLRFWHRPHSANRRSGPTRRRAGIITFEDYLKTGRANRDPPPRLQPTRGNCRFIDDGQSQRRPAAEEGNTADLSQRETTLQTSIGAEGEYFEKCAGTRKPRAPCREALDDLDLPEVKKALYTPIMDYPPMKKGKNEGKDVFDNHREVDRYEFPDRSISALPLRRVLIYFGAKRP